MDNQQGKTTEVLLAWIAGFMDGEGTFVLAHHSQRAYPYPQVSVNNTHFPTLPWFTNALDRLGLPYYVVPLKPGYLGKDGFRRKPQWAIQMFGYKRCERWCRALVPYLVTRREQAELMLEYINSRMSRNPAKGGRWRDDVGLTPREAEIADRLYGGHRRPGNPRSKPSQTTRRT